MKITVRRLGEDQFTVYLPRKDLEEPVVSFDRPGLWGGGVLLRGGMRLELPEMPADTKFPITVDARRSD